MTVNTTSAFHTIPLDKIKAGENVRDLNADHVDALASSIELVGLLTPVTVASDGKGGYNLVAGFHRFAAASKAGLKEIPAVERASEGTATDAAVENIVRKDLTPYEEAIALQRAMDRGLTEDGAAQALGWSLQLLHNRQRILAMPEKLQPMAGFEIPLNLVDPIARLTEDFPLVGQAIAANVIEGERIRNFGEWFLTRMDTGDLDLSIWNISKSFRLDHASDFKPKPKWRAATKRKIAELSKGKESWELPTIHFLDEQVDQVRALGCLIEVNDDYDGRPAYLLVDNKKNEILFELIGTAIDAYQPPAKAKESKAKGKTARTPAQELESLRTKAHNNQKLAIANAHQAQLGRLLDNMADVEIDMDVARFFVFGLLGTPYSRYGMASHVGVDIHARGFGSLSPTITETVRSNGGPGKPKISYPLLGVGVPVEDRGVEKAGERNNAALWKFMDGAKTPGELFGRALCLFAAADLVIPMVLPSSKQFINPNNPRSYALATQAPHSYKDHAAKSLAKLMKKYAVKAPELEAALKAWRKVDRDAEAELKKLREERGATETGVPLDEVADA